MVYLVTGGAGFIGSHVVRDLVKEGEQAIIYDLHPPGIFLERLLSEEERTRVEIVRGDVLDLPHLLRTIKENGVEKVIHMASLLAGASRANPPVAIKTNCCGTVNVFEAARILGLKKVFWASSVAVFGLPGQYAEEYISNEAPHYPRGVYGATKSLNENTAAYYFGQYGVDISAIRYSIVYGIGVSTDMGALIRELIENPVLGKPGRVSFGDDTLNWLYVDDAARATVLAIKAAGTKTRAYNISGDVRSIKEAVDYVRQLLPGADITLLPGYIGVSHKFETTSIEEELGFHPKWSMELGIKEMVNTVRRGHSLLSSRV